MKKFHSIRICNPTGLRLTIRILRYLTLFLIFANDSAWAEGQSYAVLSVISDRVTLVGYTSSTGSHLAKDKVEVRKLETPVFDRAVIGSVRVAIERLDPTAKVAIIPPTDPERYQIQDDIEDENEQLRRLIEPLRETLSSKGVNRLVLVTKQRAPTDVRSDRESLSHAGTLYGVGFYVDDVTHMETDDAHAVGFIAPYVYARIRLIDVKTLAVIRQQTIAVCKVSAIPSGSAAPKAWDALDAGQKTLALARLIRESMTQLIPELLGNETSNAGEVRGAAPMVSPIPN